MEAAVGENEEVDSEGGDGDWEELTEDSPASGAPVYAIAYFQGQRVPSSVT